MLVQLRYYGRGVPSGAAAAGAGVDLKEKVQQ